MTPDEFVANLETVAEAPGGIKRLRELVLDLAVRGNLTSRSTPKCHEPNAGPFAIPSHWEWAPGSSVFTFVTSGSRGWAQYYATQGPIFLRIGNLDYATTRLDLSNIQRVAPPPNAEGTRTRVQSGDILISITGDTGMVGLVPGDLGEAYINQHIALARPASAIFSQYVALALTAPFSLGRLQAAQRGIKNSLGLDDIRNLRVPLPPIAEQKRIVAKVDQLMALCDDLEARQAKKRETAVRLNRAALDALTTAEGPEEIAASFRRIAENFELVVPAPESMGELRNAILSLAVQGRLVARRIDDEPVGALLTRVSKGLEQSKTRGKGSDDFEPVDSEVAALGPAHWRWEKLGRLAEVVGGVAKGRDLNGRRTVSYPYLRVANVQRGSLDLTEVKEIEIPPEELPRYNLRPGDVLFTEGGDWDKLGRSAVWEGRVDPCLHQNHVFRARFAVGDLNPRWFSMYANSPLGRRYFEGAAKRTTNLASINMTQLRNCPMPVPPTNEQKRIVAKVDQLMALCDSLEAALRRTEGTAQKLAEAVVAEIVA